MKSPKIIAAIIMASLFLSVSISVAETKYVSEDFEITMRTGPGTDRKILALVPSGRAVEVMQSGEEWSRIRLGNGKEGWVLSRYLTGQLPTAIKLERLENSYAEVIEKSKALQEKLDSLSTDNRSVGNELDEAQKTLKKVQASYDALRKDSADFLKLKKTYEKNLKELNEARENAEKFESERNRLANSQLLEGVLYGGGLVIIGFIAGFIMKKPKRRSGLM